MAGHFRADAPRIETGEIFFHRWGQQSNVRNVAKMLGDEPHWLFRRYPAQSIELRKVHRARITAERALETEVEINVEVTHRQLTQRAINRLAVTTTGEV